MPAEAEPARCSLTREEIEMGRVGLNYLIERTRKDPYFIVASMLHSGQVPYDYQQQFVEHLMKQPIEVRRKMQDPAYALKKLSRVWIDGYGGAVAREEMAHRIAAATKCYFDECFEEGKKGCKTHDSIKSLGACMMDQRGMGNKMLSLIQEYIGIPEAVAIDRHIDTFMCEDLGVHCAPDRFFRRGKTIKRLRGRSIQESEYLVMLEKFRKKAAECGLDPATMQVAAWMKKACQSRMRTSRDTRKWNLWLGRGLVHDCQLYTPEQLKLEEIEKEERAQRRRIARERW